MSGEPGEKMSRQNGPAGRVTGGPDGWMGWWGSGESRAKNGGREGLGNTEMKGFWDMKALKNLSQPSPILSMYN